MKKYLIVTFIVLLAVTASIVVAFFVISGNKKPALETENKNTNEILYFYSDACHWCQKQKPILQELEQEGIKFKRINVGENRNLLNQYQIEGIPTFIMGEKRLTGYKSKDQIKQFWEENKK